MKIATILPPFSYFSEERPNSIETVVRVSTKASKFKADTLIFRDHCANWEGDLETYALPATRSRKVRSKALIETLLDWKPDLMEFHQHAPTGSMVSRAIPDVPSVLFRHNLVREPANVLKRRWVSRRYQAFERIAFVSEDARSRFAGAFPNLKDRSAVVTNGIDPRGWVGDPAGREPLLCFAGRPTPEKGFAEACAAIAQVLAARSDARAILLAHEWEASAAYADAALSALAPSRERAQVLRDQPLNVVRDAMRQAAIVLVPSTWNEPFGLVALEGHVAGAAVISSGRGGLREVSGPAGLFVDPVTADGFAAAALDLLEDTAKRERLAADGQRYALAHHSAEAAAARLDALRQSLCAA